MDRITDDQLNKLMSYWSDTGLGHGERVKFYGKYFPARYVCEDHKAEDLIYLSETSETCSYCAKKASYQTPRSTKHLSVEEANQLINKFAMDFDKTREMIFEKIGMSPLFEMEGDE